MNADYNNLGKGSRQIVSIFLLGHTAELTNAVVVLKIDSNMKQIHDM
jgi:hypothetical protein